MLRYFQVFNLRIPRPRRVWRLSSFRALSVSHVLGANRIDDPAGCAQILATAEEVCESSASRYALKFPPPCLATSASRLFSAGRDPPLLETRASPADGGVSGGAQTPSVSQRPTSGGGGPDLYPGNVGLGICSITRPREDPLKSGPEGFARPSVSAALPHLPCLFDLARFWTTPTMWLFRRRDPLPKSPPPVRLWRGARAPFPIRLPHQSGGRARPCSRKGLISRLLSAGAPAAPPID